MLTRGELVAPSAVWLDGSRCIYVPCDDLARDELLPAEIACRGTGKLLS